MATNTQSFMRAAAVLIAAVSLFYGAAAQASCAAPENTDPFDIRVTGSWKAQHATDGDIRGCLLTAEKNDGTKVTAYTNYEFICALKPDEKISVAPSYACCDTGLQGDFVCGVTPRVPLAVVGQTPLMISSIEARTKRMSCAAPARPSTATGMIDCLTFGQKPLTSES